MSSIAALLDTLGDEARSGRIGRPVSVRAFAEVSADHGKLSTVLAALCRRAFDWLGDEPVELGVAGSLESGHLSALARGRTGTTALVTASVLRGALPVLDVLVLGTEGSAFHEGEAGAAHLDAGELAAGEGARERVLRSAISRALEARERVPIERLDDRGGER